MDHVSYDSKYDIDRNFRVYDTGSYKKHKKTKKTTRVIKMLKVHGKSQPGFEPSASGV